MIWTKTADMIDAMAEAIYRHDGGMTDEEYVAVQGKPRRAWKTDAAWDTNPDELTEWERDEYRIMATAAFVAFQEFEQKRRNDVRIVERKGE
jgi:hypothetical protein